jgi:hypothetical protein
MKEAFLDLLKQHTHALVDCYTLWPEAWHQELSIERLVPKGYEGDADLMPGLITLKWLDRKYIELLAEDMQGAANSGEPGIISALLAAPETEDWQLRNHLTKRLIMGSPQGKFLLRYFDPRPFAHFSRLMHAPLLRALYGPIHIWTILFDSRWTQTFKPEDGIARTYWGTNALLRDRLDRIGSLNEKLKKERAERGIPWKDLSEFALHADRLENAVPEGRGQTHQPNQQKT